jgi:uncharacterized protein YndB with AHSA1/START domain
VVFAHLVTTEGMLAWMGQHAELDPVPGGRLAIDINGVAVRGSYLVVDPPDRLVWTWGMASDQFLPPGSSRVEFSLTATPTGTHLDLVHSGLPNTHTAGHATGWSHYLSRLRHVGGGGEPTPDPWAACGPAASPAHLDADTLAT